MPSFIRHNKEYNKFETSNTSFRELYPSRRLPTKSETSKYRSQVKHEKEISRNESNLSCPEKRICKMPSARRYQVKGAGSFVRRVIYDQ